MAQEPGPGAEQRRRGLGVVVGWARCAPGAGLLLLLLTWVRSALRPRSASFFRPRRARAANAASAGQAAGAQPAFRTPHLLCAGKTLHPSQHARSPAPPRSAAAQSPPHRTARRACRPASAPHQSRPPAHAAHPGEARALAAQAEKEQTGRAVRLNGRRTLMAAARVESEAVPATAAPTSANPGASLAALATSLEEPAPSSAAAAVTRAGLSEASSPAARAAAAHSRAAMASTASLPGALRRAACSIGGPRRKAEVVAALLIGRLGGSAAPSDKDCVSSMRLHSLL